MNKKLLTLIMLSFVVAGCSTFQKYLPSGFDGAEFDRLAELNVVASDPLVGDNWCRETDLNRMVYLAKILSVYSKHRLNSNISDVYNEITSLTVELRDREDPSPVYCKLKRESIAEVTEKALSIFGDRK